MADRDLRALDMRHTLPNLKNLLLTLTDGEGVHLQYVTKYIVIFFPNPSKRLSRPTLSSPASLLSNLEQLSSRPDSPLDPNSTTPRATSTGDLPAEGSSPSASGTTTPTTIEASKKSRPFLAFSPLTDFIRGRYPSSSRISTKDAPEPDDPREPEEASLPSHEPREPDNEDEDEDRRTIHGTIHDEDDVTEETQKATSLLNGGNPASLEKLDSGDPSTLPTTLSLSHLT